VQRVIRDHVSDQLKMSYALWTRRAVRELILRWYDVLLAMRAVGCAALAATLTGDNQYHRKSARRSAHPHTSRHKLAKWLDGAALDGLSLPENREELPQDHGLSRTLDAGGDSERIAVRHSTGSGVVI